MPSILVKFMDGSERSFPHVGRSGGSYTKTVTYEGGMVVVQDEYYTRTAFPQADVTEVIETPERS